MPIVPKQRRYRVASASSARATRTRSSATTRTTSRAARESSAAGRDRMARATMSASAVVLIRLRPVAPRQDRSSRPPVALRSRRSALARSRSRWASASATPTLATRTRSTAACRRSAASRRLARVTPLDYHSPVTPDPARPPTTFPNLSPPAPTIPRPSIPRRSPPSNPSQPRPTPTSTAVLHTIGIPGLGPLNWAFADRGDRHSDHPTPNGAVPFLSRPRPALVVRPDR